MSSFSVILLYTESPIGRALAGRLAVREALPVLASTPEQARRARAALSPDLLLCDLAAPEAEAVLFEDGAVPTTLVVADTSREDSPAATALVEADVVAAFIPDLAAIDSLEDLQPLLDLPRPAVPPPLPPPLPTAEEADPSPDPKRYRILGKIGEGASGEVWRAHDMLLDMDVAIKALRADLASDSESIQAMKAEARIAMELSHSNLVRLYNLLQSGGRTYLVMEYIEGASLESLLRRYGALDPELAIGVVASCAAGLNYAHRHHVLHRDLKPSNLLFTGDDKLKIIDFGVAALLGPADDSSDELAGTPQYMSPEQLRGEPLGPASDMYSLGILAYQMLTGRTPDDSPFDPSHPEDYRRGPLVGVSPEVRAVLERATAADPADRYPSMGAFSTAFARALRATKEPT